MKDYGDYEAGAGWCDGVVQDYSPDKVYFRAELQATCQPNAPPVDNNDNNNVDTGYVKLVVLV